jgi:hypothetical protein
MNPFLYAKLYAAIDKWLEDESETGARTWSVYTDLAADMTKAASMIYDANHKTADFIEANH